MALSLKVRELTLEVRELRVRGWTRASHALEGMELTPEG
jgi:hypothetical protein